MHLGEPAFKFIQTGAEEKGSLDAQSPGAGPAQGLLGASRKEEVASERPG